MVLNLSLLADRVRDNIGIVSDSKTNLIWQDGSVIEMLNHQDATDYCENITIADYDNWRLPTKDELLSIVDYGYYDPASYEEFVNTYSYRYWSSTTNVTENREKKSAWYVNFSYGQADSFLKSDKNYVRCVRSAK